MTAILIDEQDAWIERTLTDDEDAALWQALLAGEAPGPTGEIEFDCA